MHRLATFTVGLLDDVKRVQIKGTVQLKVENAILLLYLAATTTANCLDRNDDPVTHHFI